MNAMFTTIREAKEYHQNGQLMYETTFGVVAPLFQHLFKNRIVSTNGEALIRIGITRRFWDNGQLNWQLKYNDDGSLSNESFQSFRKDGSVIIQ